MLIGASLASFSHSHLAFTPSRVMTRMARSVDEVAVFEVEGELLVLAVDEMLDMLEVL